MLKGRVLLLNQDFQVLGTVGVDRSIRMSMRGEKENPIIIHEYVPDTFLTSGKGVKYPVPSVISLRHYINVRQRREESGAKRMKIYLRDGWQCQYCSIKASVKPNKKQIHIKELTLDHITPKSKGGSSLPSNLVTACKKCNQRKADRTPDEARMPLRTEIHDITQIGIDNIMLCRYVEHRPEWLPYLEGKEGFVDTYLKYMERMIA